MTAASKAVFLSYAREDTAHAGKIAEALRAAGVDVWFDQSELRGGDAWDAKIRQQIKECTLFVPIISANTQARLEGYFRIEWKLAAQRTHAMAEEKAFWLPVIIDATPDGDAKVPGEFKAVQWTRLAGDNALEKLCSRVRTLLDASSIKPDSPFGEPRRPAASAKKPVSWRKRLVFVGAGLALLAIVAYWQPWKRVPSLVSEAGRLVAQAEGLIEKPGYSRANLATAEDLARKAATLAPDSAAAWAMLAYVNACYLANSWDVSGKRRQETQEVARRALALDPKEPTAMLAMSWVLNTQGAFAQAESTLRRAISIRLGDIRLRIALGAAVDGQRRAEDALALRVQHVRLFPSDPRAHYDLGLLRNGRREFAAALESYDAALALQPFPNALLQRTIVLASWQGNFPAARETFERLAIEDRSEDGAVGVGVWLGLIQRDPARVLAAAALTAADYLETSFARGPKAVSVALAYQVHGKSMLARQQWEAAETVARQHAQSQLATPFDRALLATALAWQGRIEEAAREIGPYEAAAQERPTGVTAFFLAQFHAAVGDASRAMPHLRRVLNSLPQATDHTLPTDPRWDKLRSHPEFEALLTEARTRQETARKE